MTLQSKGTDLFGKIRSSTKGDIWLQKAVEMGLKIYDFSYIVFEALISPEFARYGLEFQKTGRKLSKAGTAALKRAIEEGGWGLTYDPIRFGEFDPERQARPLLDGLHRMTAVSQGERTVPALVVLDFPLSLWNYIDGHRPRRAADLIHFGHNEEAHYANTIAAAARTIWYIERQQLPSWANVTVTNAEVVQTLDRHDALYHWAGEVMRSDLKLAGVAACVYWLSQTPDDRAQEFIDKLIKPDIDLNITDPIYNTRRKIADNSTRLSRNNKGRADLIWAIFKQWANYTNAKPRIVTFRQGYEKEGFPWPGGAPYISLEVVNGKS